MSAEEKRMWGIWGIIILCAVVWVIITAVREHHSPAHAPSTITRSYHKITKSKKVLGPIVLKYDTAGQPKEQRDAIIRLLWKTERFLKEQGWSEAPRLPDRASGTYIEFRTCPCYGNKACIFIRNQKEMYSAYILKENLEFTLPLLLPKE